MGRLKQVLPYRKGTLVQHAVEQAGQAGFAPLIVVVGAEAGEVRTSLIGMPVDVAENPDWPLGMGSSIACGMQFLTKTASGAAAVAILLADQPLITAEHLRKMRILLSPGCSAVAAEYGDSTGVPAIFQRKVFSALRSLTPNAGAKQLLRSLGTGLIPFPLPEAAVDIDTAEDYARLTS